MWRVKHSIESIIIYITNYTSTIKMKDLLSNDWRDDKSSGGSKSYLDDISDEGLKTRATQAIENREREPFEYQRLWFLTTNFFKKDFKTGQYITDEKGNKIHDPTVYRYITKDEALAKAQALSKYTSGGGGGVAVSSNVNPSGGTTTISVPLVSATGNQVVRKTTEIITFRYPRLVDVNDETAVDNAEDEGFDIIPGSLLQSPSLVIDEAGVTRAWYGKLYVVEL